MEPTTPKAGSTPYLSAGRVPNRDQLGLIQPHDKPGEWWVTVNRVAVIGFSGNDARTRAEHHFRELFGLASPSAAPGTTS
jgi:hypothetical protein